jgi:hypothetical protein
MKIKSKKQPKKHDVWVTEMSFKDKNYSKYIKDLLKIVRKYEEVS